MNYSSFGESIGNSADHGSAGTCAGEARDGSRPPSAAWMFRGEPVWRI